MTHWQQQMQQMLGAWTQAQRRLWDSWLGAVKDFNATGRDEKKTGTSVAPVFQFTWLEVIGASARDPDGTERSLLYVARSSLLLIVASGTIPWCGTPVTCGYYAASALASILSVRTDNRCKNILTSRPMNRSCNQP